MAISYKKLWHILIDRDMKKKAFAQLAGISEYAMTRLNKNENVTAETLGKISKALGIPIEDFVDFIDEEQAE